MDTQVIFNAAVTLSGFLGGYLLNSIHRSMERLDLESRTLSNVYVRKDDYRDDIAEVKILLAKISDKLDKKQDKP